MTLTYPTTVLPGLGILALFNRFQFYEKGC